MSKIKSIKMDGCILSLLLFKPIMLYDIPIKRYDIKMDLIAVPDYLVYT